MSVLLRPRCSSTDTSLFRTLPEAGSSRSGRSRVTLPAEGPLQVHGRCLLLGPRVAEGARKLQETPFLTASAPFLEVSLAPWSHPPRPLVLSLILLGRKDSNLPIWGDTRVQTTAMSEKPLSWGRCQPCGSCAVQGPPPGDLASCALRLRRPGPAGRFKRGRCWSRSPLSRELACPGLRPRPAGTAVSPQRSPSRPRGAAPPASGTTTCPFRGPCRRPRGAPKWEPDVPVSVSRPCRPLSCSVREPLPVRSRAGVVPQAAVNRHPHQCCPERPTSGWHAWS